MKLTADVASAHRSRLSHIVNKFDPVGPDSRLKPD